jgi:uncharacterized protein (TIRG00374 family)
LSRVLRVVVAVGLTAFVLYKSNPSEILSASVQADWRWIGAAVALVLVDRTLMAYRWLVLLCALTPGTRPSFRAILRIFFVSTFVGTFLPSVGPDVYRAYSLSRLQVNGVESAASVLMDRILGAFSILLAGVVALFLARRVPMDSGVYVTLIVATVGCIVAALLVFSNRTEEWVQRHVARIPLARLQSLTSRLLDAMRRYSRFHAELLNVVISSVVVQVIRVLQAYCLGRALAIEAPLTVYFVLIPIVLLIMLIPVTINGLGTSQAAFRWLFAEVGVAPSRAVALSILFVALGIVGNLPGGLLYAVGSPARTQDAGAP